MSLTILYYVRSIDSKISWNIYDFNDLNYDFTYMWYQNVVVWVSDSPLTIIFPNFDES